MIGTLLAFLLMQQPQPAAVSKTIHLTWTASTTSGVSYNVYKAFGSCPTAVTFSRITQTAVTTLYYDDVGVGVGVYCYYATSYLSTAIPNESVPSNKAEISISEPQPQPPTNLQVAPLASTLKARQQQQFRANMSPVVWNVNPKLGSISASGLYKAPSTVKVDNSKVTVSVKTSTETATAIVTLKKG